MVTERLLQFIWQFQHLNKQELSVSGGETLHINHAGIYNTNQGPDFTNANIRIGETTWFGTIELHVKASDWDKHDHQNDGNYKNVILHVVWEDDGCSNNIPILELRTRVPKVLIQRYEELMNNPSFIACERSIHTVNELIWKSWKDRLLAERLLRKVSFIEGSLSLNNYNWEETFWWLLARNFGMKVNSDAFEAVARSIPLKILARQKNQIHQLEALLLGQAGLLEGKFREQYPRLLKKEYRFQQSKHKIRPVNIPFHFLRMRPVNFPTVRLAQLAMLVHESAHLFSKVREAGSLGEVRQWFNITANDYWHYHYRLDESSSFFKKKLGAGMIDNIIINTIVPVLFAHGHYHDDSTIKDKAMLWLQETAAEINTVTRSFQQLGMSIENAADSQALLELRNEYCLCKRCLDCAVGNALLRPGA